MAVEIMTDPAEQKYLPGMPRGLALIGMIDWIRNWQRTAEGLDFEFTVGSRILSDHPELKCQIDPTISIFRKPIRWSQKRWRDEIIEAPILAIILPKGNMTYGDLWNLQEGCRLIGIPLIWTVQSGFQTIQTQSTTEPISLFSGDQIVTAEPHLPGFSAPAKTFFTIV